MTSSLIFIDNYSKTTLRIITYYYYVFFIKKLKKKSCTPFYFLWFLGFNSIVFSPLSPIHKSHKHKRVILYMCGSNCLTSLKLPYPCKRKNLFNS